MVTSYRLDRATSQFMGSTKTCKIFKKMQFITLKEKQNETTQARLPLYFLAALTITIESYSTTLAEQAKELHSAEL